MSLKSHELRGRSPNFFLNDVSYDFFKLLGNNKEGLKYFFGILRNNFRKLKF